MVAPTGRQVRDLETGCSIPVVRAHGVGVERVQFPPSRL